jgi:hypothetical protein
MTDKNIQMSQRNADNTGWDNLFPITTADNVNGLAVQLAEKADQSAFNSSVWSDLTLQNGLSGWARYRKRVVNYATVIDFECQVSLAPANFFGTFVTLPPDVRLAYGEIESLSTGGAGVDASSYWAHLMLNTSGDVVIATAANSANRNYFFNLTYAI